MTKLRKLVHETTLLVREARKTLELLNAPTLLVETPPPPKPRPPKKPDPSMEAKWEAAHPSWFRRFVLRESRESESHMDSEG